MSSIDNDKKQVMHWKSNNIKIMINEETDEVIKELFHPLKKNIKIALESIKHSEFVFDYVQLLHYKCYPINTNRDGSYRFS